MKHRSIHARRLAENPEERRFAEAWDKAQRGHVLAYLLDERPEHIGPPPMASERDELVAATVIQWLGSPVGRSWLEELGYVRRGES